MVGLQNVHVTTEFIFLMVTAMMMNTVLLIIASYLWRDHSTLERSFLCFQLRGITLVTLHCHLFKVFTASGTLSVYV